MVRSEKGWLTVKDIKELLRFAPDDLPVVIWSLKDGCEGYEPITGVKIVGNARSYLGDMLVKFKYFED